MKIKETINKYPQLSASQIIEKIKGYDIVFFDIFDTLVKRDVYKEHDVFDLIERKYNYTHNEEIFGFRKLRVDGEILARNNSENEEVTLNEIYAAIVKLNRSYRGIIDELVSLEETIELEVSIQNSILKQVYDYCLSKNKIIYIVSDMYLSRCLIEKILKKTGYTGYKKLFLSSEIGLQKRTGNLFKYVTDSEKINKEAIVHIGDNKKSDWLSAKKAGFRTINIAKTYSYVKYKKVSDNLDDRTIWAFLNNRIPYIQNRNIAIGYEIYGPVLLSFVNWLKKHIDSSKTTFFFARDCQVVKKAYEIIVPDNRNTVYFYGSRKSLLIPALFKDASIDNLCRLIKSESAQFTVAGLLKKIGLKPQEYSSLLKKYSLNLNTVLIRDRLSENSDFVRFYNSIQNDIKNNSKDAYENFSKYLASLECTQDLQVVDIGWRCTMQYCLNNLLKNQHNIHGYYLGVREDAFISKENCSGFFISCENDEKKKVFLASMTALIEIFFSATHGSVEGYSSDGKAICGEHECKNEPTCEQLIRELHEGALQFVRDFSGSSLCDVIDASIIDALEGIKRLGTNPHKEELKIFSEFPFHMGIGVVKAAKPGPLFGYVTHPKKYLFDFSNSNWKIAFLKKTFRIKLPYYKMFEILYRYKG